MPNFVTSRGEWLEVQKSGPKNIISDILSITPSHRSHSQNMILTHWIMDCWNIAGIDIIIFGTANCDSFVVVAVVVAVVCVKL